MARIILAMILLGIAAKTDARPYNQDIAVDSEDDFFEIDHKLALSLVLADTCTNRAENNAPAVEQLFDVVCLVLKGEVPAELGSGEGSGDFPEEQSPARKWIYNFDNIVRIVTPDRVFQQALSMIAEGACLAAEDNRNVASDIESFCRYNRRSSDASVGDEIGSGDVLSGSGSGGDQDFDIDADNNYDGISIFWSSDYNNNNNNGLKDDPFFFANLAEY